MSAIEPFSRLLGLDVSFLSKEELQILEAELFLRIYRALREYQRNEYKNYFRLIRLDKEKENEMLDDQFARAVMRDLIEKEEYTLEGIARYTDTHIEIVEEIYQGRFSNPPVKFLCRLIELHRGVRYQLYQSVVDKVVVPNEERPISQK